jgi:hypothetical protein
MQDTTGFLTKLEQPYDLRVENQSKLGFNRTGLPLGNIKINQKGVPGFVFRNTLVEDDVILVRDRSGFFKPYRLLYFHKGEATFERNGMESLAYIKVDRDSELNIDLIWFEEHN